jgi:hypothetical protein
MRVFEFIGRGPGFEGAFGVGYCAVHWVYRRRPVESRDAPDALRSGNGNYQGSGVREVRRQLGLNSRACSHGELPNARAKMLPNELVGGVGQSFLRPRVILSLGRNSTGQHPGENLQTTDLGQHGRIVEVGGCFQSGLLRGFISEQFAEVREFGLRFAAGGDGGFEKYNRGGGPLVLNSGTSNIQHRTPNIE